MHTLTDGDRRSRGSLFARLAAYDINAVRARAKRESKQTLLPPPVLSQLPFARQLLVAQASDPVEDILVLA